MIRTPDRSRVSPRSAHGTRGARIGSKPLDAADAGGRAITLPRRAAHKITANPVIQADAIGLSSYRMEMALSARSLARYESSEACPRSLAYATRQQLARGTPRPRRQASCHLVTGNAQGSPSPTAAGCPARLRPRRAGRAGPGCVRTWHKRSAANGS
jgi:hypothetical protein